MFLLLMTMAALELTVEEPDYEDIALPCYSQFLTLTNVMAGNVDHSPSLWDAADGFFKDVIVTPEGERHRILARADVDAGQLSADRDLDEISSLSGRLFQDRSAVRGQLQNDAARSFLSAD